MLLRENFYIFRGIMKKYILSILFLSVLSVTFSSPCCSALASLRGVGLGGYWELTAKYYPKTIAYFDKLKEKYPALASTTIIISDGPMADTDTIYFPMKWIEELEKGNKFYIEATEWILLHEMGHIAHYDSTKSLLSIVMFCGFSKILTNDTIKLNGDNTKMLEAGALMSALAYMYFHCTREYYADDYAMQHCDNPAAWLAAYEFLDRQASLGFLPGIMHSFTTYRLSRIAKAFKNKFGYELEIIPQSLCPEYLS